MIKTVITCPLGHQCETVKGEEIHRCAWFTELAGKNPQTGEMINDKGCAIAWLPIMQVETAQAMRGTNHAVVTLREETIKRQDMAIYTMKTKLIEAD